MLEPGSDSSQVRGYRVWQIPASQHPGPAPPQPQQYLLLSFGPPGSSLSGSQNILWPAKGLGEETIDSLPSPHGGSGTVGRSRRQNTTGVPEAPEQRVRVSRPQPSPRFLLSLLLLPPLIAASRAHLSKLVELSQLPRSLWGSGHWERAGPTKTQKAAGRPRCMPVI